MILYLLAGAVGAAAMYLLDPKNGEKRRDELTQHVEKLRSRIAVGVEPVNQSKSQQSNDAPYTNRTSIHVKPNEMHERRPPETLVQDQGSTNRSTAQTPAGMVQDETILARVREAVASNTSHPSAVLVTVNNGRVTLTGNILEQEVTPFLSAVREVKGVNSIDNQLNVHREPGSIPDLQGRELR